MLSFRWLFQSTELRRRCRRWCIQLRLTLNYGLSKERLLVAQAFVGKDKYLKRFRPHGKGKAGKMERPRGRLTVIVKEMSEETEADLARLMVFRRAGTRMSRSEGRLVPHRLLETRWKRQRTPPGPSPSTPEAATA